MVTGTSDLADGTFELVAAQDGTVVRDAFFLRSELAKGGFDPHNH